MSLVGVVKVSLALPAVIVDCHDPRRQAEWWAHALAYQVSQRNPDAPSFLAAERRLVLLISRIVCLLAGECRGLGERGGAGPGREVAD